MNGTAPAPSKTPDGGKGKSKAGKIVRDLVPLALSALLIIWLFHKVDIHRVMAIIHHGFNFWWILAMMLLTTASRTIRGIRWGIQLRAAGIPRMSWLAESVSIYGAYALNLLLPWLGEAWRCVYVSKREKAKITTVVGTDFGDRLSDFVVIILLVGLSFVLVRQELVKFMDHYALGREIQSVIYNTDVWIALGAAALVLIGVAWAFRKEAWMDSVRRGVQRTWEGFAVIFTMKGRGLYIVLTVAIWVCYFFEYYLCFYAFSFTSSLTTTPGLAYGLLPGLVVFVFGSMSMGVPSNGGLGPWNIAVMFALSLYGISDADGAAFSLVVWTFQNLMQVLLGIVAAVYVIRTRRGDVSIADTHYHSA